MVLLATDLAFANARHVLTVPQEVFEGKPDALQVIEAAERKAALRGGGLRTVSHPTDAQSGIPWPC